MVSPRLGPDHLRYARERKVATLSGRQRRVAEIREGAAWTVWWQEDCMRRRVRAACCGLTVARGCGVRSVECGPHQYFSSPNARAPKPGGRPVCVVWEADVQP
eukprot:scaffold431_cov60-Phaeocystis_antarctica.AAC.2